MVSKTKPVTPVKVAKSGLAVVHMHRDISAVNVNGESFSRPRDIGEGRTWSFECAPEDARDLIDRYEFASGSESGVALTVDEKSALADLESRSQIEVGKLSSALAQLAREQVQRTEA